ncbi:hypothetical protein V6N13_025087 [Hibiscus sabdariffa]
MNAQGCGHRNFLRCTCEYLRDYCPNVCVFLEPRISHGKADQIITALGFPNSFRVEALGFSKVHPRVSVAISGIIYDHLLLKCLILGSSLVISTLPSSIKIVEGDLRMTWIMPFRICFLIVAYVILTSLAQISLGIEVIVQFDLIVVWATLYDQRRTKGLLKLEQKLLTKLESLLDHEEQLWKQKSQLDWIQFGDKNTKFFHAKAISRCRRKNITMLKIDSNEWCNDQVRLRAAASTFFTRLFAATTPSPGLFPISGLFLLLEVAPYTALSSTPIELEIKDALFSAYKSLLSLQAHY